MSSRQKELIPDNLIVWPLLYVIEFEPLLRADSFPDVWTPTPRIPVSIGVAENSGS